MPHPINESCRCLEAQPHRHLGYVEIARQVMEGILFPTKESTWFRIKRGLPLDARFLAADYDMLRMTYRFLFESPEFPSVLDGVAVCHAVRIETEELFMPPGKEKNGQI